MKKYLLLTLLIIAALKLDAQVEKKHYLGAHYSYGKAVYSKGTYKFSNNQQYEGKDLRLTVLSVYDSVANDNANPE